MALAGSSARRYAQAMLELAEERRSVDEWRASLDRVAAALDRETLRVLASPSISMARRRTALERASAQEPAGIRALLMQLLARGRIVIFPNIVRAFHDLLDAREGIVKGVVTTAVPIDERARRGLVGELEKTTGRKLRATFSVDPAILGGTIVRLGDRLIDASIRGKLAALRERLVTTTT